MICKLAPTSVADPDQDPGFVAFMTPGSEIRIRDPGSGMEKNLDLESGMNIPIIFPRARNSFLGVKNT
jgi:hypothetical protein